MITLVGRATRCILGWPLVWERTKEAIQLILDQAPKAKWYFSDGFDAYSRLWYHYGRYEVSKWKNDTFLLKAIMLNSVTISLAWIANPNAFRVVPGLCALL